MKRTTYQREHTPTNAIENKCQSSLPANDGFCQSCGRLTAVPARAHKPNQTGRLGWTLYYGDASSLSLLPGDHPSNYGYTGRL